jgi:flagellar hook assembly protein FlgD
VRNYIDLPDTLPQATDYSLSIYDVTGRLVRRFTGQAEPGVVLIVWNGTDDTGNRVGSGVYFCRVQAGAFTDTRRMTLLK